MTIGDIIYLVMWLVCSAKSKSHVINTENYFHVQVQTYASETWNGQFFIFTHYFLILTLFNCFCHLFSNSAWVSKSFIFACSDKKLLFRSSHQRCSVNKAVYKNFAKFAGKHLCWSLFFNKVAGLRLKKRDSLCEIWKTSANSCFWLFLFCLHHQKCIRNPVRHLRWNVVQIKLTAKRKMLHRKCLIRFWMSLIIFHITSKILWTMEKFYQNLTKLNLLFIRKNLFRGDGLRRSTDT